MGRLDLAAALGAGRSAAPALAPQPARGPAAADEAVEAPGRYGAVDGRVAHRAGAQLQGEPALDLLGGPLLLQELAPHQGEQLAIVQDRGPSAGLPALFIARLGGGRPVEALARVAGQLARDGRLAAADGRGDFCDFSALAAHEHDVLALA